MSSMIIGPTELNAAFKDPGYTFQSNIVTNSALELCSQYGKTPEELALQYESFAVTANIQSNEIDAALIGRLRTFLAKQERKRKNNNNRGNQTARKAMKYSRNNKQVSFSKGPNMNQHSMMIDNQKNAASKTPSPSQYKVGSNGQQQQQQQQQYNKKPTPPTQSFQRKSGMMNKNNNNNYPKKKNKLRMKSSYKDRAKRGQILHNATYNQELLKNTMDLNDIQQGYSASRCTIQVMSKLKKTYPFMYTPPTTKAMKLEEQFHIVSKEIMNKHKLSNVSQVGVPNQESVLVLGRICCEASLTGNGILNEESVWLEGSKEDSNGVRVRLNLQSVKAFSIFPGQIVGCKGICPDGETMTVERLYTNASLEQMKTSPEKLLEFNHGSSYLDNKPMQVMISAGPYCVLDDLEYDPLGDILDEAKNTNPDVLILAGPFVDVKNDKINNGEVYFKIGEDEEPMELNFKDLFSMQVVQKIDLFLESNPNTRIVIVPSPNDAHHPSVFPQSPFNFQELFEGFVDNVERLRRQVTLVSNPSMFKINEIVFGISTTDIIKHLGPEDTTRVATGRKGGLFTRLPSHLWNQQSFYPMYPPGKSSTYDLNQMEHVEMNVKPDVLILSSIFNPIAVEMDKVIVVNPGRLTKGLNGGTFARMTINPLNEDLINEAREDETSNHDGIYNQVYKRAAVQLIRI